MDEKKVLVRVWRVRQGEVMVAVCDRNLVGRKFSEGRLVLDVSSEFYGGEAATPEAAVDHLRGATVANLVGEEAVRCGIEAGLIHEECVMRISGVPHAQFILM